MALEIRGPQINRGAGFHNQGLAGLLEEGTCLAACNRFLDTGGDMGKALQVEGMLSAEVPVEVGCKQTDAHHSLGNSCLLEGWCNNGFDNGVPGRKRSS